MRKILTTLTIGIAALSMGTACTQKQQATFWQLWHKAHPGYCAEDDLLWNGHDHKCETPNEFCKHKYGKDAVAKENRKTGDIGCIRLAGGIHATFSQVH